MLSRVKTEKVPIHKKPPNLLDGLKACPRKGELRLSGGMLLVAKREWSGKGGRKALDQ